MQLDNAISLLEHPLQDPKTAQQWLELGSGNGTFTRALAHILPPGSNILAVDKDANAVQNIPDKIQDCSISKLVSDMEILQINPQSIQGILMANALHYIIDQEKFIEKAAGWLKPGGCFLIVEYDSDDANRWVPYPLSFERLKALFSRAGFSSITKLREQPSIYQRAGIYAALITA